MVNKRIGGIRMDKIELTQQEIDTLHKFISVMTYHDMIAILCRCYEKDEMEDARGNIIKVFCRLANIKKDAPSK
jgi:hypothetical protein